VVLKVLKVSKASKVTREIKAPKASQAKTVATVTKATQAKTANKDRQAPRVLLALLERSATPPVAPARVTQSARHSEWSTKRAKHCL